MTKNKLKHLIICVIWLSGITVFGQQNTVTTGGDASSTDGSVSYSIGQLDYVEASGTGGSASQGVQQPIEVIILGSDDYEEISLIAAVYPNPTVNRVTLTVQNMDKAGMEFQLHDLSGRLLQKEVINHSNTFVSMEHLSSSTYFLAVLKHGSVLKTFKIIKH
ncbi:MAG: T9SS C-terminal target domain-containing protein [Flavobacterium sp.]|nr:MAG: T9SS C-terminal target domain-containing protein [Flavobacterium sp.]